MSRYTVVSTVFLVVFLGSLSLDGVWNFSLYWYMSLVVVYLLLNVYGSAVLSAQYFVPARTRAQVSTQSIALTFDDGPVSGHTERILDILKRYDVPAAFFCIGHRVKENPLIIQRIHAEGHVIGNHSYTHKKTFDLLSAGSVAKELAETNAIIRECIGLSPKLFRPPFGVTNPMIAKAVARKNLAVIGWSIRSLDSIMQDRTKLLKRVTRSLKGGDVILFHDYSEAAIAILPDVIDHISRLGLKIERVDRLLNERAYA